MSMLKGNDIVKSFGDVKVLQGVNIEVAKGEIVSIAGASGAGKSTLLHILGTLDLPNSGNVILNDTDVTHLRHKELARFRNKNIGFVFQFHNLLPEFTALENVAMPGYLSKRPEQEVNEHAKELLSKLGLEHRFNHKPNEMSGGEQQRTAVARALINDPLIVFADEPSGNLDSKNAEELHQYFFKLRDEMNQTLIMVTHNEELARRADRKMEMKDGLIVDEEK